MLNNVYLGAVALGASLLQSVSGFGFGIVFMALTPLFIPYGTALGISTILSGSVNIVILRRCWRDIDFKQLWLPLLFCLCGSTIGTFLIASRNLQICKTLSGMLGHYSTAFTLDVYGHVSAQMQADAAQKMGGFISGMVDK